MKPFQLIVTPLAIFIMVSVIYNNAQAWQLSRGTTITQDVSFQILSNSSPLLLIMTGQFDVLWSLLQTPSANWSILTFIIDIVLGAFMLLFSLGVRIAGSATAATVGVSSEFGMNPQGTKLIQTLGIGLIIWAVAAGSLGGWEANFNSVASGLGTAFNLILQFVFIIGCLWQSQTTF